MTAVMIPYGIRRSNLRPFTSQSTSFILGWIHIWLIPTSSYLL